jgi:hypothetical protein
LYSFNVYRATMWFERKNGKKSRYFFSLLKKAKVEAVAENPIANRERKC